MDALRPLKTLRESPRGARNTLFAAKITFKDQNNNQKISLKQ